MRNNEDSVRKETDKEGSSINQCVSLQELTFRSAPSLILHDVLMPSRTEHLCLIQCGYAPFKTGNNQNFGQWLRDCARKVAHALLSRGEFVANECKPLQRLIQWMLIRFYPATQKDLHCQARLEVNSVTSLASDQNWNVLPITVSVTG